MHQDNCWITLCMYFVMFVIRLSTFATMRVRPHKDNVLLWPGIVHSIISGQVAGRKEVNIVEFL